MIHSYAMYYLIYPEWTETIIYIGESFRLLSSHIIYYLVKKEKSHIIIRSCLFS